MNLGILYKDGKIVNHRSLVKVLLNPILRYFGYYIGSICIDNEIRGVKLERGQKVNKIKWDFKSWNDHDKVIKKRVVI
jgi:hypothetical protein